MRKFSPKKLYKLIKILVILITVVSLYLAYDYPKLANQASKESTKAYKICLDQYQSDLKNIPNLAQGFEDNCIKLASDSWTQISKDDSKNGVTALFIGILLPILFFGGTWLYKYLFPVKQSD